MQVKKESVQQAITDAAMTEFARYGYKSASMRRIAAKADTQMSNIYNYFKGKEDMYAYIIGDQYNAIQNVFNRVMNDEDNRISFRDIRDTRLLQQEIKHWLSRFDVVFNKKTIVLITASDGTRFAGAKSEIVKKIILATGKSCGWYPTPPSPDKYPIATFVEQLVDNVIDTYRKHERSPVVKQIVFNQLLTAFVGFFIMTT